MIGQVARRRHRSGGVDNQIGLVEGLGECSARRGGCEEVHGKRLCYGEVVDERRIEMVGENCGFVLGRLVVASDMAREIVRQETVVVYNRPAEPPVPYEAVGKVGTHRPRPDQDYPPGVGGAPSGQPGQRDRAQTQDALPQVAWRWRQPLVGRGGVDQFSGRSRLCCLAVWWCSRRHRARRQYRQRIWRSQRRVDRLLPDARHVGRQSASRR